MSARFKIGQSSIIEENVYIGAGVWIGNFVHIRPNVRIGNNSEIRDHVFLAEGCEIGMNTRIYQFANICSGAIIGDNCFIGTGTIFANDKEIVYPCFDGQWLKDPPIVADFVRVGVNATILPGVHLAHGCRIGAGAVVVEPTQPYTTYVGNPARPVKS